MSREINYVDFNGTAAKTNRPSALEADRYTSADYFHQEWENVWRKSWLLAGMEGDIPEAGDYFIFELAHESIIITRTEDGEIKASFNACKHRGNKIFTNERGAVEKITCPYHGWTYELDGTLAQVPDPHRFSQGLPCEELSLKKVRCETWDGFVWVTLNPEAKPLGDFLGVITDILDPYRFRDMVLVKDQTVCLDANWKTVMDNFSELYHVDFLHPQHATFVDCRDDRVDLWPYGHTGVYVDGYVTNPRYPIPDDPPELLRNGLSALGLDPDDFKGRVPDIREAVQKRKREIGPELGLDYADFTDEQVSDVWQFNLFPNIIMTIKPEELWVMRPRPHATDPGKCYFDKWTLQIDPKTDGDKQKTAALALVGDPDAVSRLDGERPERQVFTQDQVIAGEHSMTITIDQDVHYLRDMQAGMLSEGYDRAWLNDDESRVQHFHDWLDVWMERTPI